MMVAVKSSVDKEQLDTLAVKHVTYIVIISTYYK